MEFHFEESCAPFTLSGRTEQGLAALPDLEHFLLRDVEKTADCKPLGRGSFGIVEQVYFNGTICAAKQLHDILIDPAGHGLKSVCGRFLEECRIMSSVRHPNIVQFLGLCKYPTRTYWTLVMEQLAMSLDDLLTEAIKMEDELPLSLKISILTDVAKGLVYLHNHSPQIIHRDLTSRNVLLTLDMQAKITDLGNALIIDSDTVTKTMSQAPGTTVYMPPEATERQAKYNSSIDMFSYGVLALYTAIQQFPKDLPPATYTDENTNKLIARSEIERRHQYIVVLYETMGEENALTSLIKRCLENQPKNRPSAREAHEILERLSRDGSLEDVYLKYRQCSRLELIKMLSQGHTAGSDDERSLEGSEAVDDKDTSINADFDTNARGTTKDADSIISNKPRQPAGHVLRPLLSMPDMSARIRQSKDLSNPRKAYTLGKRRGQTTAALLEKMESKMMTRLPGKQALDQSDKITIGVPGTLTVLPKSKRGALNRKKNKGFTFQITRSESTASLVYYEAKQKGTINLATVTGVQAKADCSFELCTQEKGTESIILKAPTEDARDSWVRAIQQFVSPNAVRDQPQPPVRKRPQLPSSPDEFLQSPTMHQNPVYGWQTARQHLGLHPNIAYEGVVAAQSTTESTVSARSSPSDKAKIGRNVVLPSTPTTGKKQNSQGVIDESYLYSYIEDRPKPKRVSLQMSTRGVQHGMESATVAMSASAGSLVDDYDSHYYTDIIQKPLLSAATPGKEHDITSSAAERSSSILENHPTSYLTPTTSVPSLPSLPSTGPPDVLPVAMAHVLNGQFSSEQIKCLIEMFVMKSPMSTAGTLTPLQLHPSPVTASAESDSTTQVPLPLHLPTASKKDSHEGGATSARSVQKAISTKIPSVAIDQKINNNGGTRKEESLPQLIIQDDENSDDPEGSLTVQGPLTSATSAKYKIVRLKSVESEGNPSTSLLVTEDSPETSKKERPDWAIATCTTPVHSPLLAEDNLFLRQQKALFVRQSDLQDLIKIGEGQFGKVYKATLVREGGCDKMAVAVKTIKRYKSEQETSDFLREMGVMMNLMHPNVVHYYGIVQQAAESPWLVMEYLPHKDLKNYLMKTKRSVDQLIKYMIDVAMGMHYIVQRGLIHRDLAARNVMVDSRETCKVADFGLLRELPKDNSIYQATTEMPWPIRWMAPESLVNNEFSPASDVWSYGVLLWEMFFPNKLPYAELSNFQIPSKIPSGYRLSIPPSCPDTVASIMKACWQKKPEKRPSFMLITSSLLHNMSFPVQLDTSCMHTI